MRVPLFIRKLHKWLGLIIGIQVIFWVVGGLIMSSFPIEQVHGDHLRTEQSSNVIAFERVLPLEIVAKQISNPVVYISLEHGVNGAVYEVITSEKERLYLNAETGKVLEPITEEQAKVIARQHYALNGDVVNITLVEENNTEYRKRLPAWKVDFDDSESTSFYIAADNGQLMSVRNSMWRIFDFVWMLHIMDYKNREDFNNWLLIISAAIALILSLSGGYLVFKTIRVRRKRKAS